MVRPWIRYVIYAYDVFIVFAKINCNDGAPHFTIIYIVIFSHEPFHTTYTGGHVQSTVCTHPTTHIASGYIPTEACYGKAWSTFVSKQ